jgi:cytochrome c oxidase subunit 2
MNPRAHARRLLVIWIVLSIIGVLAIVFLLNPHMPPGNLTDQASQQTQTNTVIAAIMAPIAIGVVTFFVYALFTFRARDGEALDGPNLKGDAKIARTWIITSTTIVLALAIYGTVELLNAQNGIAGAGGGQGSSLIASAPANALRVQVIAQQWHFTYRYPQYGKFETFQLAIPVDRPVIFSVTSIDVTHSFWAYQLAVKADAVPGAQNLVGTTAKHTGTFDIRCAELCGVWHGHMFATGHILSQPAFATWIRGQQRFNHIRGLPPNATVYYPAPNRRGG